MKIEDMKLTCCEKEFPATAIEFDYATGGCDSCGYGASAYLELIAMCPVCDRTVRTSITV